MRFVVAGPTSSQLALHGWVGAGEGGTKRDVFVQRVWCYFASLPKLTTRHRGVPNDTTRSVGAGHV